MKAAVKTTIWLVVAAVVVGGAWLGWRAWRSNGAVLTYRIAPVTRGDLLATIGATGTLEPEEAIDVGAQVTGQIRRFGADGGKPDAKPLDRRSVVKKGDLLAEIDDAVYQTDLDSAKAQLESSNAQLSQSEAQVAQAKAQWTQTEANIVKAQADIRQMEAKRVQAEQDWNRAQKLKKEMPEALADTAFDNYKAVYMTAVANVESAQAALVQVKAASIQSAASQTQAEAAIKQAKAQIDKDASSVKKAQRNLDFCTILSPVDGEIIDRRVNIGQTVVSNLSASSLFLIAKDLSRMQIWVSVNEADISSIHANQPVTFTVDAQGGKMFQGTVTKVRFDATMTQNVVTYPVEVTALNPDRLLFPYMTTNVQFELDKRTGVLKVPNAALRYSPQSIDQVAPEFRADLEKYAARPDGGASGRGDATSLPGNGQKYPHTDTKPSGDSPAVAGTTRPRKGVLWAQQGEFLRPIAVRVGMSDGAMSEVMAADGSELKEGLNIVVAEQQQGSASAPAGAGGSPFMPQIRRR
jgi:HlyD family secretion protein